MLGFHSQQYCCLRADSADVIRDHQPEARNHRHSLQANSNTLPVTEGHWVVLEGGEQTVSTQTMIGIFNEAFVLPVSGHYG